MTVNTNKAFYYKFTDINTIAQKFYEFFRELLDKLNEEEKKFLIYYR